MLKLLRFQEGFKVATDPPIHYNWIRVYKQKNNISIASRVYATSILNKSLKNNLS